MFYCSGHFVVVALESTNKMEVHVISAFWRDANEVFTLFGWYAELSGSWLPTFRDNLSVRASEITALSLRRMGQQSAAPVKAYFSVRSIAETAFPLFTCFRVSTSIEQGSVHFNLVLLPRSANLKYSLNLLHHVINCNPTTPYVSNCCKVKW